MNFLNDQFVRTEGTLVAHRPIEPSAVQDPAVSPRSRPMCKDRRSRAEGVSHPGQSALCDLPIDYHRGLRALQERYRWRKKNSPIDHQQRQDRLSARYNRACSYKTLIRLISLLSGYHELGIRRSQLSLAFRWTTRMTSVARARARSSVYALARQGALLCSCGE